MVLSVDDDPGLRMGRINRAWAAEEERVARMLMQWRLRGYGGSLTRANVITGGGSGLNQAVLKVASRQSSAAQGRKALCYIGRLDREAEVGAGVLLRDIRGRPISGDEALQRVGGWCDGDGADANPRDTLKSWHLIVSPGIAAGEEAARVVGALERSIPVWLNRTFGAAGHDVLWAVHLDTDQPHVHLLVQNQGRNRKLWFDRGGEIVEALRQELAHVLSAAGLPREATRRVDRPRLREAILDGMEALRRPVKHWRSIRPAREIAPDLLPENRSTRRVSFCDLLPINPGPSHGRCQLDPVPRTTSHRLIRRRERSNDGLG